MSLVKGLVTSEGLVFAYLWIIYEQIMDEGDASFK